MWPEDVREYFGDGDECQMAYHFPLMPRMYMAIAQEDRHPVVEILAQTPDIPPNCQWAIFLRNHDELTLEMVTQQGARLHVQHVRWTTTARWRASTWASAAEIWRRCWRTTSERIKLMNSLLLSMPGTPGAVLRRRDRHGRQHLPGRPRRRAHADAVGAPNLSDSVRPGREGRVFAAKQQIELAPFAAHWFVEEA
jgi:hypothetical protein